MPRLRSHSYEWPALVLAVVALARPSLASDPVACASFCWIAPDGCPSEQNVRERIEALTGDAMTATPRDFVAQVSTDRKQWQVRLTHAREERVITASNCADLAEAAAVVVALALAPQDASASAVPDDAAPPELPQGAAESGVASSAPIAATPQNPTTDSEVALAEDAAPSGERDESMRPFVLAAGVWDAWLLPKSTFGLQIGAGLSVASDLRLAAHGTLLSGVEQGFQDAPEVGGVEYGYVGGGVSLCWLPVAVAPLSGCAASELGWLSADAPGLLNSQSQTSVVPSLRAALKVAPKARSLSVDAGAEAGITLLRDSFTINGQQELHRTPVWTLRLVAGLVFAPF